MEGAAAEGRRTVDERRRDAHPLSPRMPPSWRGAGPEAAEASCRLREVGHARGERDKTARACECRPRPGDRENGGLSHALGEDWNLGGSEGFR